MEDWNAIFHFDIVQDSWKIIKEQNRKVAPAMIVQRWMFVANETILLCNYKSLIQYILVSYICLINLNYQLSMFSIRLEEIP